MSTISTRTVPPERSTDQRHMALQLANYVRSARSGLKRDLSAGMRDVHDLLDHPPGYAANMPVGTMLLALPRWGDAKVGRVLSAADISPRKTIGGLTWNQRERLHRALNGGTWR